MLIKEFSTHSAIEKLHGIISRRELAGKALFSFNRVAKRFEIIVDGRIVAYDQNYALALAKFKQHTGE